MRPQKKFKIPEITETKIQNKLKQICVLIIALFAILLYVQSASFSFTADDSSAISKNGITKEGIKGIPIIITKDYWYGYKDSIRVPEYRPLSLVMFATEYTLWKDNPHFYHLVNVLLYSIICWLIFLILYRIFNNKNLIFPFICALLYTAHPIHTEVVDSIKSRDELLCFLFALLSLIFLLKSLAANPNKYGSLSPGSIPNNHPDYNRDSIPLMILAVICYFFSLLSKETGIVYVLIVPLLLYVFTNVRMKNILYIAILYAAIIITYLLIRWFVLKDLHFNVSFNALLNNSLLAAPDIISQKATAFYVLFRYILLLLFPYPLSYDYSYATIPIFHVTDPAALFGIILYFAMGLYAFINIRKIKRKKNPVEKYSRESIIAFAILFYLLTLLPVSNLLIMIGSPMAERFLFMPSLGFTMILAFILLKLTKTDMFNTSFNNLRQLMTKNTSLFIVVFFITGIYSVRTIARSRNWKDNYTLFGHDIEISKKSARAHFNYGVNLLYDLYPIEKNKVLKKTFNDKSIIEFKKAAEYYPNYIEAYINLGYAYMNDNDFFNAIKNYEMALSITHAPNSDLFNDLGIAYISSGQYEKASSILDSAIKYFPKQGKAYNDKAGVYLEENNNRRAILYGKKAIELDTYNAKAYRNLGYAYCNLNILDTALKFLNKAIALDSLEPDPVYLLGLTYYKMGELNKGQQLMDKAKRMKKI